MNREACKILNCIPKKLTVAALAIVFAVPLLSQDSTPENDDNEDDYGGRVVLVSLVDRQLAVIQDGEVIATFQVAVGADVTPSPAGEFKVVNRLENPTYYHPGIVIPAGKDNPLGTRWLGLSQKGYGIHGTNAPRSIGQPASHGCIRLRNRDVEKLFTMVNVGDTVKIRAERDGETARIFGAQTEETLVASAPATTVPAGQ